MEEQISFFSTKKPIVCVQGLGFVGSAMSIAIANARDNTGAQLYNVIGIDVPNESGHKKALSLNNGIFPFENSDKKMDIALKEAINKKNLHATTNNKYFAYASTVVVDINLDVLYDDKGDPYLNLELFKEAIKSIGEKIRSDTLLLIETTVPPGTCEKLVYPIIKKEFGKRGINSEPIIAHSYERVMPGEYYLDSIINFWRVYSGIDDRSADRCRDFLTSVISTETYPLTRLHNTTATEIAKVLENSYRATTIAFMEEWSRFAEAVGVDLFEVIDVIRMRPTHSNMRQPGFGVGGYCLTKDPYFAKLAAKEYFSLEGHDFPFCTMAVKTNNKMPIVSLNYLEGYFGDINGKRFLVLGVSYRQDVGDTRYSPTEIFAREAVKRGAILDFQDPLVTEWKEMSVDVKQEIPDFCPYDAVIFTVQHKKYNKIDFKKMNLKRGLLVFDANKVLRDNQIEDIKEHDGVTFRSIGRSMK